MAYKSEVRDEQKQRTRRALLDAARSRFLAEGVEGPSLDAICDAAGCTRGAFYVHFANREALAVAVMDDVLSLFLSKLMTTDTDVPVVGGIMDGFLRAIDEDNLVVSGGAQFRFHHLLDACGKYPTIRERYLALLDFTEAQLALGLAGPNATESEETAARGNASVLLAAGLGLLALKALGRPIDTRAFRIALSALTTL